MIKNSNAKCAVLAVGIDNYEDNQIPRLRTAESDAAEVLEAIRSLTINDMKIADSRLLLGKKATYLNIRNSLNDLLWYPNLSDLVIFYYAGNMYVDKYAKSYIVPYDITTEAPFLRGLRMGELGDVIYQSPDRKSIIIILDCSYSGISEDDRSLIYSEPKFRKDFLRRIESDVTLFLSKLNVRPENVVDCPRAYGNIAHTHSPISAHLIKNLSLLREFESVNDLRKNIEHSLVNDTVLGLTVVRHNSSPEDS